MSDIKYYAITGAAILIGTLAFLCLLNKREAECKALGGEFHYISHGSSLCMKPGTVIAP